MKVCDMLHKLHAGDPRAMGADKIVKMVYDNNREIARLFWPKQHLGALEQGARGDAIVMDYRPFTPMTTGNLPWHMLFGMSGGMVTDTICNGRILMRKRELLTLDEAAINAKARQAALRAWKRVQAL
jgi:cytosine/adenosine deaminase-related metal-dependent hydrolase